MAARAPSIKIGGSVQGVLVTAMSIPAARRRKRTCAPGDVIVEVQSQPVKTPDDVAKRVDADAKAGKKVELLLVNRDGDLHYVGIDA